jgi:hypothetical protein
MGYPLDERRPLGYCTDAELPKPERRAVVQARRFVAPREIRARVPRGRRKGIIHFRFFSTNDLKRSTGRVPNPLPTGVDSDSKGAARKKFFRGSGNSHKMRCFPWLLDPTVRCTVTRSRAYLPREGDQSLAVLSSPSTSPRKGNTSTTTSASC